MQGTSPSLLWEKTVGFEFPLDCESLEWGRDGEGSGVYGEILSQPFFTRFSLVFCF